MNTTTHTITTVTIIISFLDDFFDFLRKEKALIAWMTAFEEYGKPADRLKTHRTREPIAWIEGAFIWSRTREGLDYWSDLNSRWRAYLKEKEEEVRTGISSGSLSIEWKVVE